MAEEVFWKQWEKADSGRLKLITKQGCVGELMDEILDSISSFQEHVRIKRIQSDAFEQDKKDPDVTVLQCDLLWLIAASTKVKCKVLFGQGKV